MSEFLINKKNVFSLLNFFDCLVVRLSPNYKIIDINQSALSVFGWQKKKILQKNFYMLFKKHKIKNFLPKDFSLLKNKESLQDIQTIIKKKKKSEITINWKIHTLVDKRKTIKEVILIGQDITQQKNLEDKIFELDSIIAQMPGNVYWYSKNLIYLGCNENSAKTIRMSREEAVGKKFKTVLNNIRDIKKEAVNQMVQDGLDVIKTKIPKLNIEEIPFVGPIDEIIQTLANKVPLYDKNGKFYGVLGISTDITERKRAEAREKAALTRAAEAKANEAKAEAELRRAVTILSGSIAHDLRTPILALETDGQIIQECWPVLIDAYRKAKAANLLLEEDNAKLERNLTFIENIGVRLQKTTSELHASIDATLKTLSRTLRNELHREDLVQCSLWHCLFNALERYPFSVEERKLIHWEQSYNFEFLGNEVFFIRMISNLLNNALYQIRKNNRGEIFISGETAETANILQVKDTAGGVSAEMLGQMFDGYRSSKVGGTGIGLAFCKYTMKNFGGDIICNSIEGESTEFILSFPKL